MALSKASAQAAVEGKRASDLIKPSRAERWGLFAILGCWIYHTCHDEDGSIPLHKHLALVVLWSTLFYLRILKPRVRHNTMRTQENLVLKQRKTLATARKKMEAAAKAGKPAKKRK